MLNKLKHEIKKIYTSNNSLEVSTPSFGSCSIWKQTKHTDKYIENMYNVDQQYYLKPMNCPMHIELMKTIYNNKSVLPLSVFEFNHCFRKEKSGSINGLLRLLRFTQDDCHTIINIKDTNSIILNFIKQIKHLYATLDLHNIQFRLSDTDHEFIGNQEDKKLLYKIIYDVLNISKVPYTYSKDGAFYGPKLDIIIHDYQNREWQTGTLQLDLCLLNNLNFTFQNNDKKERFIVIHQAILGTFERFIGILLNNGQIPDIINPYKRAIIIIQNDNLYHQLLNEINTKNIQDIDLYHSNKYELKLYLKKINTLPYIDYCILGQKEIDNNYTILQNKKTKEEKKINIYHILE